MRTLRKLLLAGLVGYATSVSALPVLQLTIEDGNYVGATDETTYASGNPFTLYALLTPPTGNCDATCVAALLADTYYISAAVAPKTGPTNASLGSFVFDGNTVNVTSDMVYGTPPLETAATQLSDSGDLSDHGIFDTFFKQFSFHFSAGTSTTPFDAQTTTPTGPLANNGGRMYFVPFTIDVALLDAAASIHFDLYNSLVVECGRNPNCVNGDIDINDFAPPSHDAQSSSGGGSSSGSGSGSGGGSSSGALPEPATLALVGLALAGLGFSRRKHAH